MFSSLKRIWKLDRGFQLDLLLVFSYLILGLFFFWHFLTGENILGFKDLSRYFYPLRHLMVEEARAGLWPLWNPYNFCGYPLLATLQVCFFYPLTIIYYILPFNLAFNYYIIFHYFLAACFMYAMLRHFRLARSAAYFGGLVFAFSGYLLSVSNMNTSLSSVIWLPLVVLCWDKLVKEDGNRRLNPDVEIGASVAVSSLLLAFMFLGGEPTIVYTTLWFLFFYGLAFSNNKIKTTGLLVFSSVLAAGLVAIQLIPFIELAMRSERVSMTSFQLISSRSFPPRELINFILPYFFGNSAQMGSYTEALLGKMNQDWLITPYMGTLPLIMIFFARRDKRAVFFGAAALVGVLLALGRYTPIYQLVYYVPGVSMIRYPVKYLFLAAFCLSALSALGFDQLANNLRLKVAVIGAQLKFLFVSVVILVCICGLGYLSAHNIYLYLAQKYSANIPRYFFDLLAVLIQFNLQSLLNLTAYLAAFCLLLWLFYRGKISRLIYVSIIILITVADLFAVGASVGVSVKADVFRKTPENYAVLLKDKGLYRFFYSPAIENEGKVIRGGSYSEAVFNAKDNFVANWPLLNNLFDFHGYESVKPLEFSKYYYEMFSEDKLKDNLKFLSAYNVKYLVLSQKYNWRGLKLLKQKHKYGANVYLYENLNVLPRAYMASGTVKTIDYRPGQINMVVQAGRAGTLFLSEIYYPGWKAFVDGQEVEIVKAKQFFSALNVPAGNHNVKYVYDPLSFRLGIILSLLAGAGLLGFGLTFRRKQ